MLLMTRARIIRSATAVVLLGLLGVLSTGLPSHHHEGWADRGTEPRLSSPDHHTHGTELVEQDQRVPSGGVQLLPSPLASFDLPAPRVVWSTIVRDAPLRPTQRAPPPDAPRAPPRTV